MVMIPPIPGGGIAAGGEAASVLGAARAVAMPVSPGFDEHKGWDDDGASASVARDATRDGSRSATRGAPADNDGFTVQGKLFDPILEKPMVVSADTHADFWEDDMDYSESVVTDGSESRAASRAASRTATDDKTCPGCPPEGKVAPMMRRCARWSEVTISYQTRICGTFYNPETQQIQEFKYCGVSFDGWKRMLCQFWEAKARYDQFFDEDSTPKRWWTGYKSAVNQASRHQSVASANQPVKIVWIFMQPKSQKYFSVLFSKLKDIITRWQP